MKGAILAWLRARSAVPSERLELESGTPEFRSRGLAVTVAEPEGVADPESGTRDADPTPDASQAPVPRGPALDANGQPTLDLPERYQSGEVLGRGGMGTVRAVRDTVLCREVAVKLLDPSLSRSPAYLQGFVEEARIAAQLDHPNVAPVHELGSDASGTVYFTMKRVAGATLHSLLADPSLPPGSSERLSLGLEVLLKVCDALEFAHSRGVLHRDIKPANIMVGGYGEVYLMDWGLAKVLRGRAGSIDVPRDPASPLGRVREGTVGTPSFMSPEMARGESDSVDETSDVFGLGAVLYAIVTGQPPFHGEDVEDVLTAAKSCAFTPPDKVGDLYVPKKLARIVMKAMAPDRAGRYPSVGAFAEALRAFLHRGLYLPRAHYKAGEIVVAEGSIGDSAYIITRGRCVVYKTVAGERRVLREMGLGALFGEAAVLGAAPRTATVEALTDVTLLVISQETIAEGLGSGTWESLMVRTLVERFRELDAKLHVSPGGGPDSR